MKAKAFGIWIAVALVLAAIYHTGVGRPASPPDSAWIFFKKESIGRIDIMMPAGPRPTHLRFDRFGDTWIERGGPGFSAVGDTPVADTESLSALLDMLLSLKSAHRVSDSPAKYPIFDLGETTAVIISIGDTPAVVLHAGKSSDGGEFTYMRRPDDPQVWAVKGFDRWRLLRMLD